MDTRRRGAIRTKVEVGWRFVAVEPRARSRGSPEALSTEKTTVFFNVFAESREKRNHPHGQTS